MAAIYQWFPTGRFIDYEFVLMSTDEEWKVRYVGYDYNTNTFTDYGQFWVAQNCSVVSDGKNVFVDNAAVLHNPVQYIYRGHCFTKVAEGNHGGSNTSKQMAKISATPNRLMFTGVQDFGYGINTLDYEYDSPYLITSGPPVNVNPPNNGGNWGGIFDLNVGNNGLRGYGDQFVVISGYANFFYGKIETYEWTGVAYSKLDEYTTLDGVSNHISRWGCNHQTGELVGLHWFSTDTRVFFWEVDLPTGAISYVGQGATTLACIAAGFTMATSGGNSYVITAEYAGLGGTAYIRTYSRSGFTITQVDEVAFPAPQNSFSGPSIFQMSRMTGRIWFFTPNTTTEGGPGNMIIDVDASGQISILFRFYTHGSGSSGYMGQPVAFLDAPLIVVPNGFEGIKSKLFECWELNEVGSVNRVGSLNGTVLTPTGTVTNRAGHVGNAADFNGASSLAITGTSFPQEMRAVDDFTICLDVMLDSKATTQQFIGRGRNDFYAASPMDYNFAFYYSVALDRFVFEVRETVVGGVSTTTYTVIAHALGSPAISTWYHVCVEYNKTLDQISISVNDGAVNTTVLPLGTLINSYSTTGIAFTVGRRSSVPTEETIYLDGAVDQIFWFWDILTPAEKTWMYNSGNSRAFSEL